MLFLVSLIFSVLCIFLIFFTICLLSYIVTCKKENIPLFKKKTVVKKNSDSFFTRLFYSLPLQLGRDFARDLGGFDEKGIIIFEGDQGDGKTISVVKYAYDLKNKFPSALVLSNTPLTFQDDSITSFNSFVDVKNGSDGIIGIIDECQLWANSKLSREVDFNLLEICCQNRKNRRVLLMTGQRFYMLNKDIRCLCKEVRSCKTLFGCLTFVVRRKPFFDSDGKVIKSKFLGIYFFVQDDKLRSLYDTYATISSLSKSGFKTQENRLKYYE